MIFWSCCNSFGVGHESCGIVVILGVFEGYSISKLGTLYVRLMHPSHDVAHLTLNTVLGTLLLG